jgi:hypothetical protein
LEQAFPSAAEQKAAQQKALAAPEFNCLVIYRYESPTKQTLVSASVYRCRLPWEETGTNSPTFGWLKPVFHWGDINRFLRDETSGLYTGESNVLETITILPYEEAIATAKLSYE